MCQELASLSSVVDVQESLKEDQSKLKQNLQKAERKKRIRSLMLTLPMLAFIMVTFVVPIAEMLYRSIDNPLIAKNLPNTVKSLSQWDQQSLPAKESYEVLAKELITLYRSKTLPPLASRLNIEVAGMRSLMMKTGRKLSNTQQISDYQTVMITIDKRWQNMDYWGAIKNLSSRFTMNYYLAALDFRQDAQGEIVAQPEHRQVYVDLFLKTIGLSMLITGVCLLLGYPLAYLLATLPDSKSNLLLILVLLPFWTSLLVRTTSWIVILQMQGVVNDLLLYVGIITERIQLVHNTFGTVVAMVHILLPFMILPLYSVMKGISSDYFRAARSLGATPTVAFVKAYMPLTMSGVGAGVLLTFILSIGFYITPALVGGRSGQMISNFIAYHMQTSLNWGMASALGAILLLGVLVMFYLFNRIVGINNIKVGG
ncbi:MAG: ABC transporter permease [Aliivibrio sp.]|uniref:ABC transporter permease n=1 Tax=Aliivibrio sp. TaxID=1872443 RepID=UPI001A44CC56|nr:ABC transporter permease [Aliivibrio sp.]